jgi:predicted nucleic acid-binding protein
MSEGRIDFIADTSAIICLCRRRDPPVEEFVKGKNVAITFVTMAELTYGALKANNPQAAWTRVVEVILNQKIFHVSQKTPAHYAHIYDDLEKRGSLIPVNDIWIAAVAVESGLPLLARNAHFSKVSGLDVIPC